MTERPKGQSERLWLCERAMRWILDGRGDYSEPARCGALAVATVWPPRGCGDGWLACEKHAREIAEAPGSSDPLCGLVWRPLSVGDALLMDPRELHPSLRVMRRPAREAK